MNSIKRIVEYTGVILEGADEMFIRPEEGSSKGIGTIVSNVAVPFQGKKCKLSITVEIEEI